MSCHPHNSTEALSPYTRDGPGGPTPTTTHQDNFARALRGVLGRINARIRDAVVSEDIFNLRNESLGVDDVPDFNFPTDDRRIRGFLQWLREQLDSEFLTVVGPDRNQFLRAAYAAGIRNVQSQLRDADVSFERADVDDLIGRPIHRIELQTLYTRTYENLESVAEDVSTEVRDELTEGFAEGESPTKIANRITDRVDSIGKNRSTILARSEVMNSYTVGTTQQMKKINRDTQGDTEVAGSHGVFDAATGQPNRTCAFCMRLSGTPLKASELASGVVQFRGDVYRLGPPAHPNGRCQISVRVGGTIDTPLSERLPAEITQVT